MANPRDLWLALLDVDVMCLNDAEAADFGPLRMGVSFREDGLSEEETRRAWEIVAAYRERFAEDVRTIGPTLTREEVERLCAAPPLTAAEIERISEGGRDERFTEEEQRRLAVAFEMAIERGGPGVHPRNIARVLYPIVQRPVARWSLPRSQGRRRSRRVRTSTSSRGSPTRKLSGSDDDPDPSDLHVVDPSAFRAEVDVVLGGRS